MTYVISNLGKCLATREHRNPDSVTLVITFLWKILVCNIYSPPHPPDLAADFRLGTESTLQYSFYLNCYMRECK